MEIVVSPDFASMRPRAIFSFDSLANKNEKCKTNSAMQESGKPDIAEQNPRENEQTEGRYG